jgi:hypothetical protein
VTKSKQGVTGRQATLLVNVPLGLLNLLLAQRTLPLDRQGLKTGRTLLDHLGTLLLALTLSAYALAMTIGRGHFASLNVALLLAAALGLAVR